MATNNIFRDTDLAKLNGIIQNSMMVFPKEIIVATLRDFFSQSRIYHYVKDAWGFPKIINHKDLPLDVGVNDDITTRIDIGEKFGFNIISYPSIIVSNNGARYVPISMNREKGSVFWEFREYNDGYGNSIFFKNPKYFQFRGVWEGSIAVEIMSRSLRARDDLVELVSICLTDIAFDNLVKSGIIVKPISIGSPNETDDRSDKVFRQTITFDFRTEWTRQIPVNNIVEAINFAIEFGVVVPKLGIPAQNLTIRTRVEFMDALMNPLYETFPDVQSQNSLGF